MAKSKSKRKLSQSFQVERTTENDPEQSAVEVREIIMHQDDMFEVNTK